MTTAERLFDLSNRLRDKATDLLHSPERTHDEFLMALVLEFIGLQILEVCSDTIECEGTA